MSSFTIDNLLRKSNEFRFNSTPKAPERQEFGQHHDFKVTKPAADCRGIQGFKRWPVAPASLTCNSLFNKSYCTSNGCCGDVRQRCLDGFISALSYSKPMNTINMPVLQTNKYCLNSKNYGVEEHKTGLAKLYTSGFIDFPRQQGHLNNEEKLIIRKPIPLRQTSQKLTEKRDVVKALQGNKEKVELKYDWMVNPRPFYRKGEIFFGYFKTTNICVLIYVFFSHIIMPFF